MTHYALILWIMCEEHSNYVYCTKMFLIKDIQESDSLTRKVVCSTGELYG